MNILFIVPSLYHGGAERVVSRLASALCSEHSVHVLLTWPEGDREGRYAVDPRVSVYRMEQPSLRGAARRIPGVRTFLWIRQMHRLKRDLGIDVSVSFLTSCNFDNVLSRAKDRTVISVRSTLAETLPPEPGSARKERFRIRYAAARADAVAAVTESVAKEQIERYAADPSKVSVIPNFVDARALREKAARPAADAAFDDFRNRHDILFITAGRLTGQKGHAHLLRAFRETVRNHPGAGLVILGKGELKDSLEGLAGMLGLTDDVYFAGFRPDPCPYFGRSDVFVLSSSFEGMPNALLEAVSIGLPAVCCDCASGPRDVLSGGSEAPFETGDGSRVRDPRGIRMEEYGILVPVCREEPASDGAPLTPEEASLAEAMLRLASDEELRRHYRERSLARAEDFAPERILSLWKELLK